MTKWKSIVQTTTPAGPASRRYAELYEQIRRLNFIADNAKDYTDEERNAARLAREQLTVEAGAVFDQVLEENRHLTAAEPVIIDHGLAMLMSKVLLEVRNQLDREIARNDLTPYMWSMLVGKRDAVSRVFRMIENRPVGKIEDWIEPEFLLVAEYDDDSVDFMEAHDREEAEQVMADFVERGAVVTRYAVFPERGDRNVLFYPVLPHENHHRPMTQRQYDWVLRTKGAENLALPENLDDLITHSFSDMPDVERG